MAFGELVPLGGGDVVTLTKKVLVIGRRENCDIVLRFPNVSGHHCQLSLIDGYWFVRDLKSSNGVKVNGVRVPEKRLDPGAVLGIAKHFFKLEYSPEALGASGPPPIIDERPFNDIFGVSLLERAGLARPKPSVEDDPKKRYDVTNNRAGQIPKPGSET